MIRLTESELNKIIKEGVKRALREEWYPEDDDDIEDYYYGLKITMSLNGSYDDLSDEKAEQMRSVKDVYLDPDDDEYCSVLITNVDVQKNEEYGDYDITVTVAVSAPDMPIHDIEEEAKDRVWLWADQNIGKTVNVTIEEEEDVFDRRVKNRNYGK